MNKIHIISAVFSFIFITSSSARSQYVVEQQSNVGNQTNFELQDPSELELQDESGENPLQLLFERMEAEILKLQMEQSEQQSAREGTLLEVVADNWKLFAGHAAFTVAVLITAPYVRNNLIARGVLPLAPATERALRWISYAVSAPLTGYAGYVIYSAMNDDTVDRLKKEAF